jgi:hypothetical protein
MVRTSDISGDAGRAVAPVAAPRMGRCPMDAHDRHAGAVARQPRVATLADRLAPAWSWAELAFWSVAVRMALAFLPMARVLRALDVAPKRHGRESRTAAFPTDTQVRLAGACLGRSLARSQYLRLRGVPHRIVIGVTGGTRAFRAHAWIAPYEEAPEGFVELRSIER